MITLKVITRFNKPILIRYKNLDHLIKDLGIIYQFAKQIKENKYILKLNDICVKKVATVL